ncbi:MAG: peptidoglycan DD-metalloendopeptidase family protein [Oscillospiraceae bacterium]|nr:peptidoglycan DD-metalloendopeptidase family protein [Oscillospiraceae bacterium]
MIKDLFLSVVNMSITASFAIIAVLILRLFLKKQPKIMSYALWLVVLFRLLCPWSLPSEFSAYNALPVAETTPAGAIEYIAAEKETYIPSIDAVIPDTDIIVPDYVADRNVIIPHNITPDYTGIISAVWITGVAAFVISSVLSAYETKRLLAGSAEIQHNVFCCDRISTAFVYGIVNPRIYLPAGLNQQEQQYIIRHEKVHIGRKDYIFKFIGFIALCIHWFNPLVWLAFRMAEKDMEMACDEAAIRKMGAEYIAGYSSTLLKLSTGRHILTAAAFGESNIKERIVNILNYKKNTAKYMATTVILLACAAGILMLNPTENLINNDEPDSSQNIVYHTVSDGETVWEIAEKYNTYPATIMELNPDAEDGIYPGDILEIHPGEKAELSITDERYEFFIKPDEPLEVMAETAAQVYFNTLNEPEKYTLENYTISHPTDKDEQQFAYEPYINGDKFYYSVRIEYDYEGRPEDAPMRQEVMYIQAEENSRYKIIGVVPPVLPTEYRTENNGRHIWPLIGGRITRGYSGQYPQHNGIDIAADIGTGIFAVAAGTVITVESTNMGYGIYCVIDHGDYRTLYAHCDALEVLEGQKVQQGQLIGYVGNTGNSTGPHLHLEVYKLINGEKVTSDPLEYS